MLQACAGTDVRLACLNLWHQMCGPRAGYCRVLRIPRTTLQELAAEFPHDIGVMLRDMGLTGRRNMARMRWHMVWGKVSAPLPPPSADAGPCGWCMQRRVFCEGAHRHVDERECVDDSTASRSCARRNPSSIPTNRGPTRSSWSMTIRISRRSTAVMRLTCWVSRRRARNSRACLRTPSWMRTTWRNSRTPWTRETESNRRRQRFPPPHRSGPQPRAHAGPHRHAALCRQGSRRGAAGRAAPTEAGMGQRRTVPGQRLLPRVCLRLPTRPRQALHHPLPDGGQPRPRWTAAARPRLRGLPALWKPLASSRCEAVCSLTCATCSATQGTRRTRSRRVCLHCKYEYIITRTSSLFKLSLAAALPAGDSAPSTLAGQRSLGDCCTREVLPLLEEEIVLVASSIGICRHICLAVAPGVGHSSLRRSQRTRTGNLHAHAHGVSCRSQHSRLAALLEERLGLLCRQFHLLGLDEVYASAQLRKDALRGIVYGRGQHENEGPLHARKLLAAQADRERHHLSVSMCRILLLGHERRAHSRQRLYQVRCLVASAGVIDTAGGAEHSARWHDERM